MLPESALLGKRIVVTRPANQSRELVGLLREHGAIVENVPCIRIVTLPGVKSTALDCIAHENCDWIFFTSANAATELAKQLGPQHFEIIGKKGIAVIGGKTAQAARLAGFRVDFEAAPGAAEEFGAQMLAEGITPTHVFYPASILADDRLERRLHAAGVAVTRLDIYRTVSAVDANALRCVFAKTPDAVVFYSPSAAQFFFDALPREFRQDLSEIKFAAIGATTARTLREIGIHDPIIAGQPVTAALVEALVHYFRVEEQCGASVG
ncbi:MAG: uroporphyrinogen-III synthase [bacterium]